MEVPIDELDGERLAHGGIAARDGHHRRLQGGQDRLAGAVDVDPLGPGFPALPKQFTENGHRRVEQLPVAEHIAVAGNDHGRIERVDLLQGVQPPGRVAAERERDGVDEQVPGDDDPFLRQVEQCVARCDCAIVMEDLDLPPAEVKRELVGEREGWKRMAHRAFLLEEEAVVVHELPEPAETRRRRRGGGAGGRRSLQARG